MRRFILLLSVVVTATVGYAQLYLGLRDTRYVNVGYCFNSGVSVELEHSVYAEKFKFQHIRGAVDYANRFGMVEIGVMPYAGVIYTGDYYDLGAYVYARFRPAERLVLAGCVNPHYDSTLDYKTCFMVDASCRLYKELSAVVQYTTVPEFREREKRFRVGVSFDLGRLMVKPLLSIPIGDGESKSVRVAVQMRYCL